MYVIKKQKVCRRQIMCAGKMSFTKTNNDILYSGGNVYDEGQQEAFLNRNIRVGLVRLSLYDVTVHNSTNNSTNNAY